MFSCRIRCQNSNTKKINLNVRSPHLKTFENLIPSTMKYYTCCSDAKQISTSDLLKLIFASQRAQQISAFIFNFIVIMHCVSMHFTLHQLWKNLLVFSYHLLRTIMTSNCYISREWELNQNSKAK